MPKIGMEPIRRQQLIQATMEAIDEVGLADATIARIAHKAGVSTGIISHYFGGKDGLFEATMRHILGDLGQAIRKWRDSTPDDSPHDHLHAIIRANFDRSQVDRSVMKTWLAFWATSMHRPDLQRLQRVNDRRLFSNLCHQFHRVLPHDKARNAARGLAALIDGLWLRGALVPDGFDTERAIALAYRYADEQLAAN
nr:transcriptional regulator BetI [Phytohalomonas tamaricis]